MTNRPFRGALIGLALAAAFYLIAGAACYAVILVVRGVP